MRNLRGGYLLVFLIIAGLVGGNFLNRSSLSVNAETTSFEHPDFEEIKQLLEEAAAYTDITEAYDLYRRVLELDPLNRDARKKIIEIVNAYKVRMDEAAQQENVEQAKQLYEQYRNIVRFLLLDILGVQLKHFTQKFRESEDHNHEKSVIILYLNNIIGILMDIKHIYEQYPGEKFTLQIKKIEHQIKLYKEKFDHYIQ